MTDPRDRIDQLQDELAQARDAGDEERGIRCLTDIARCGKELGDFGLQNFHLDIASREIGRSGHCSDLLHQVVGDRALLMRRAKRFEEALELYEEAAEAAREFNGPGEEALWIGKQGHIHRLEDRFEDAAACYREAHDIFSGLGEEGGAGVADQEGNLGILAQELGDPDETLRRYRRAVELAERTGEAELLGTWTKNYANELARRRFYTSALDAYAKAYASVLECDDDEQIHAVVIGWSSCAARAHRRDQSADFLLQTAERLTHPRLVLSLMRCALIDMQILDQRDRMREALAKVDEIGDELDLPEQVFGPFRAYVEHNDRLDAEPARAADGADDDEPSMLELYIVENMSAGEKEDDADRMLQVAELVCDVQCGLANPSDDEWASYVRDPLLRYRVIADTIGALVREGRTVESLELSQRFKGAGFRLAALQELRGRGRRTEEEGALLAAQAHLEKEIEVLRERHVLRPLPLIESVRGAGEQLLEASALLKETDRILAARLGGLVQPSELLDAMPVSDPVAICDFFTSYDGTAIHILLREGDSVEVHCGLAEELTWEQYGQALKQLVESGFNSEISARQREALLDMGKVLHDRLMCGLAKSVRAVGVTQFVLVPDAFLQSLPLGLSWVCGEEMQVSGVTSGDENLFAEVFPLEMVPCLQAIAVSQHQKRPRAVTKVLSVSDPKLDLPGSFYAAQDLEQAVGGSVELVALPREKATLGRFLEEAEDADIIVLGTHGEFEAANPMASRLLLHDRDWTLEDMLRHAPFRHSPVVILNACEVGAVRPGSDAAISGIPGALISAGAACVVASSWPLIDIAAGYLVGQLIHYLAHPGYRPAAALFRALRDLRGWEKDAVLAHTAALLKRMEEDGSADRFPEEFMKVDKFYDLTNATDHDQPLCAPEIWGGLAAYGSGWSTPAGAYVGSAGDVMALPEIILERQAIKAQMEQGELDEALARADELLPLVEGAERARLLELKAQLVWREGDTLCPRADLAEALELLADARFTAEAEKDEQLVRNIESTRQKILL